ncbi:hypothetical protein F2Q69_00059436 [Brassica cretica]|uniref:Uncharacterized protein n=1 Tax=Brassica cretica TaxID=69181 RepID=A0A8S9RN08_BRACR|nr:hypothetical protein F2Q69_00059436 [Brassica cretica]
MENTSQDVRSALVQIHPSWLCPRRRGSAHERDNQQGPQDVSDQTSCVPAWPKSSESLRILALEKYPKKKSMMGSNKEARSSAQSPVHAVRAKRAKRETLWSESELAHPKLILA